MSDYKLLTFLIIMLSVNFVLALTQQGIDEINNEISIYNRSNSPTSQMVTYLPDGTPVMIVNSSDGSDVVVSDSIDSVGGAVYTDTFKTTQNYINTKNSAYGLIRGFFSQPYQFMRDIGFPLAICTAFGVIWYAIAIILFIGFLRGSNQ